jgi:hypothetical protein
MSKSKLVGLLVLGVVLLALYCQSDSVEGHSPAQAQQVQKPYLLGSETPIMAHMEDTLPPAYSNSPSDLPDYQKFQNYVYQKYRVTDIYRDTGNWEIYYRQGFGTPISITTNNVADIHPDLNQPGTSIVFSSERTGALDIYSMNIDGSALTRLTSHAAEEYSPRWSADGSRIVYVSERNGVPEIFIMNANGSGQTRLTYLPALGDYEPSFSPDGTRIAYIHQMDDIGGSLWVMDADGSDAHQVTDYMMFIGHPAWSPDGSLIGFDGDLDGDAWNELGTVRPDGSELQEIFDFDVTASVDAWMGNWSSDGELIILTRIYWCEYDWQSYICDMDVYTLNLNGGMAKDDPVEYDHTAYPDWYQQDTLHPISALNPLPEHTAAFGTSLYWNVVDPGPSGFFKMDIEERKATDSAWADIYYSTIITVPPLSTGTLSCGKYYFRARAEDHAENWEDWPADPGEIWTTFYKSELFGRILDSRGHPLPNTSLAFGADLAEPLAFGLNGSMHGYLCTNESATFSAIHDGYGVWNKNSFVFANPANLGDYYLPPEDNIVVNGELNTDMNGWTVGGNLPPILSGPRVWGGAYFGNQEIDPTVDSFENVNATINNSAVRVTDDGTIHVAWVRSQGGSGTPNVVYYSYKMPGESWSDRLLISDPLTAPYIRNVHIDIGSDNTLYFVWENYSYSDAQSHRLILRTLSEGGVWSDPFDIVDSIGSSLSSPHHIYKAIVDHDGNLHIAWQSTTGLWYRLQLADGTWQSAEQINSVYMSKFAFTLDDSNKLYLVYYTGTTTPPNFTWKTGAGPWQAPTALSNSIKGSYSGNSLLARSDGSLMLVWLDKTDQFNYYLKYTDMNPEGIWTDPVSLSMISYSYNPNPDYISLLMDKNNNIHVVIPSYSYTFYWIRKSDGSWTEKISITDDYQDSCIGAGGTQPLVTNGESVYSIELPLLFDTTLSQAITIPSDMDNPTLAFNYYITNNPGVGEFDVSIDGTPVFSSSESTYWKQGWADLTAWSGQTVELLFSTQYDPMAGKFDAYLDNVTVGQWITPVITTVTPGQFVESWTGQVVTISGENFIDPVTVKVGDQAATPVIFINENTLQVTLPDGLTPGSYAITVTNPEGQTGVKPSALWLGITQFLPMLIR